jgi:hypothetical protein
VEGNLAGGRCVDGDRHEPGRLGFP